MDRFAHKVSRIGRMSSADSKQTSRMASLLFFPEPKRKFDSMCLLTGTAVFNANLEMLQNETPDDLSNVEKLHCPLSVGLNESSLQLKFSYNGPQGTVEKRVYVTLKPLVDLRDLIYLQKHSRLEEEFDKVWAIYQQLINLLLNDANKPRFDSLLKRIKQLKERVIQFNQRAERHLNVDINYHW